MDTPYAILKKHTAPMEIFPDGMVPLKSIIPGTGKGRNGETIHFVEVDLTRCTGAQVDKMIQMFKLMGVPEATKETLIKEGYRILKKNIETMVESTRMFM